MSTLPFTPKLRRFGPFLIFFFFLKKKFKKKKKGNQRWLEPPPCPKMGWSDHPLFGQGVASATPYGRYGVAEATPRPLGVIRATPKATKKKKKKRNGFVPLGVAGPPPRAWGGFGHPLRPHPGPWGWSGHPQQHKPISFFFFFLGGFRGGRTTPKGLGVASATPYGRYGVAEATLWPKRGWSDHPIFGQGGGSSHPRFPPLFFFFFLISS
jgi:hypothetical protein